MKNGYLIGIFVCIVLIGCAAYIAGRYENGTVLDEYRNKKQREIDSLVFHSTKRDFEYKVFADSVKNSRKKDLDAAAIIKQVKAEIFKSIKQNDEKVFKINDTALQRYVDSLRATTGIKRR